MKIYCHFFYILMANCSKSSALSDSYFIFLIAPKNGQANMIPPNLFLGTGPSNCKNNDTSSIDDFFIRKICIKQCQHLDFTTYTKGDMDPQIFLR
jgi:hypothetical protein